MNDALILMQFRDELTTVLKTTPSRDERLAACRRLVDETVARMPHLTPSTALSLLKDVAMDVHTNLGGKP